MAKSGTRVCPRDGAKLSGASPPTYLAIDLGAESGRAMVGSVSEEGISVEAVHRFANRPVQLPDRLAWNIVGLFEETIAGILAAGTVRSLAVDGWGVDFGLLRDDGSLVALPRSYRDPLTAGILPQLFAKIDPSLLFARTGIQNLEINTLCQLLAMRIRGLAELDDARRLLMIPDLLQHWLGADPVAEWTNATTTQFASIDGDWADDVLQLSEVGSDLLPSLVQPGTVVGRMIDVVERSHAAITRQSAA